MSHLVTRAFAALLTAVLRPRVRSLRVDRELFVTCRNVELERSSRWETPPQSHFWGALESCHYVLDQPNEVRISLEWILYPPFILQRVLDKAINSLTSYKMSER